MLATSTPHRSPARSRLCLLGLCLLGLLGLGLAGCGSSATPASSPAGALARVGHVTAGHAQLAARAPWLTSPPRITTTTASSPSGVPSVQVGAPLAVHPVDAGFLGLSIEYYALTQYAGGDPSAIDPVFLNLVRGLDPGASPVLRVGGDSTDWAWLATPGLRRVPGLKVQITPAMLGVLAAVTRDLNARLLLGINLEADSGALATHLADTFLHAVGSAHVAGLEIGNEPELYDALGWYAGPDHRPVLGRPRGYDLADYTAEFDALARVLPPAGLAGPASGSSRFDRDVAGFVHDAHRLGTVTVHTYPMETCGSRPGLPTWPTIAKLLAPASSLGLAQALEPAARAAGAAHRPIRVDEINSVSCFGLRGVSNTYAAALWAVQTAFQFAREGFAGLNLTTLPSAAYRLWSVEAGGAAVAPEYLGLLDFAAAVPPGSRLLSTPDTGANPQVFAVRTPSGQIHVVVVDTAGARRLAVRIPDAGGALGTVSELRGPSLSATSGVTLAGQSFGPASADGDETTTGTLTGTATATRVTPVRGAYVLALPADSVTTLSLG